MSLPVTGGLPGSSSFICHISRPSNLGQYFYYIAARAVSHPYIVAPASLLCRDQRNGEAAKNSFAESDQLVTFSKLHLNETKALRPLPTMSVFISRVTEDFDLCLEATGEAEPRGGRGAVCKGHGFQFDDTGPA